MPPSNIANTFKALGARPRLAGLLEVLGAVVKGISMPSSSIRSTINYDARCDTRGIIVLGIYVSSTSYSY